MRQMRETRPAARITSRRVIALRDSKRLRTFMEQPLGKSFEPFEAIDGRGLTEVPGFNSDAALRRTGGTPSGGEMGAALSHAGVMCEFAEQDGPESDLLLVAEDDTYFLPGFEEAVDRLASKLPSLELAVLGDPFAGTGHSFLRPYSRDTGGLSWMATRIHGKFLSGVRAGHVAGPIWGASANLVSRAGARKLHRLVIEGGGVDWLADDYGNWARRANVEVTVVRPRLVTWFGSSEIDANRVSAEWVRDGRGFREQLQLGGRWLRLRRSARATLEDLRRR